MLIKLCSNQDEKGFVFYKFKGNIKAREFFSGFNKRFSVTLITLFEESFLKLLICLNSKFLQFAHLQILLPLKDLKNIIILFYFELSLKRSACIYRLNH